MRAFELVYEAIDITVVDDVVMLVGNLYPRTDRTPPCPFYHHIRSARPGLLHLIQLQCP